ncbi:hypothetical protein CPB86DRAFT_878666 [Serendipita vermifera]|nr:hypothetical protein CPB86DRAFT_878666 [Serendipita vermifera]
MNADETVEDLRHALCSRFKPMFKEVYPYDLELWKLNTPIYNPHLKDKLPELYEDMNTVATRMYTSSQLSSLFNPLSLPVEHIHVIVRKPQHTEPNPSENGANSQRGNQTSRYSVDKTSKFEGSPLRCTDMERGGPSSQSFGQWTASPGLVETRDMVAPMMTATLSQETKDKISAIHREICSLSTDDNLADPGLFVRLPFPSPLAPIPSRFQLSKVNELEGLVRSNDFEDKRINVYLDGSTGTGKSHLLAALAVRLIKEGNAVIYIPDCGDLVHCFEERLRATLCFAFYNNPVAYKAVESASGIEELLKLSKRIKNKYIIIDHFNSLVTKSGDSDRDSKEMAWKCLWALSTAQRYIYSASPNIDPLRTVKPGRNVAKISFLSGMNEEETDQWYTHYESQLPSLSQPEKNLIKYLTGWNPLLLQILFYFKGSSFDESMFMDHEAAIDIQNGVTQFFDAKMKELEQWPQEKERYFQVMEIFLRNGQLISDDKTIYDPHYFYVQNKIGYCMCGVVAKTMMPLLRSYRFRHMKYQLWYDSLRESQNPIVKGFIAEQILLYLICIAGLPAVDPGLTQMEAVHFSEYPFWEHQIKDADKCRLHIPMKPNFPYIDAVIIYLDTRNRHAYLYPLQITINRVHKNSELQFYTSTWPTWKKALSEQGFTASFVFVWIGTHKPTGNRSKYPRIPKVRTLKWAAPIQERATTHVLITSIDKIIGERLHGM